VSKKTSIATRTEMKNLDTILIHFWVFSFINCRAVNWVSQQVYVGLIDYRLQHPD
jgi:hypothetical protein